MPSVHLICFGDSLTSGSDWMHSLDDVGYGWTWEDHGVPADKSWHGAVRFADWLTGAQPEPGDVVVLMWGTNDVRKTWWTVDVTVDPLAEMAEAARAAGYPVVVVVPPPFAAGDKYTEQEAAAFNARLDELDLATTDLGDAQISAFEHWLGLPGFPDLSFYLHTSGRADGVHPGNVASVSGQSGRYHLAESIADAVALPEAGTGGLLLGALLIATIARWRRP